MKKFIAFTTLIIISSSIKAEYEGYRAQLSIEKLNGQFSIGYIEFPHPGFTIDSLKSTKYLKEILNKYVNGDQGGNFIYYKEKISSVRLK